MSCPYCDSKWVCDYLGGGEAWDSDPCERLVHAQTGGQDFWWEHPRFNRKLLDVLVPEHNLVKLLTDLANGYDKELKSIKISYSVRDGDLEDRDYGDLEAPDFWSAVYAPDANSFIKQLLAAAGVDAIARGALADTRVLALAESLHTDPSAAVALCDLLQELGMRVPPEVIRCLPKKLRKPFRKSLS